TPLRLFVSLPAPPPLSTLFPYTTLFRSSRCPFRTYGLYCSSLRRSHDRSAHIIGEQPVAVAVIEEEIDSIRSQRPSDEPIAGIRSEEHTSELQSRENLVCRLLLEKKKKC